MTHPLHKKILEHNKKNKLSFDKENHVYKLDQTTLPSVTNLISKYFPFKRDKIARDIAEKNWCSEEEVTQIWDAQREYGNIIHELAEDYCSAKNLSSKEKAQILHVISFFADNPNYEIISPELRIFSRQYSVAGTIDLLLLDKNTQRLYILDWKTSKKPIKKNDIFSYARPPFQSLANNKFIKYSLQLSSYQLILKEEYAIEIFDSLIVHLKEDLSYIIIEPLNLLYEAEELLSLSRKDSSLL